MPESRTRKQDTPSPYQFSEWYKSRRNQVVLTEKDKSFAMYPYNNYFIWLDKAMLTVNFSFKNMELYV